MSRLPGIRFETLSPPIEDVLPRMDIAAFVGFAASGPIGLPVAVEDIGQFATIFGADIPLARTGVRGETLYGYLAPTVRAFFRNGGRRCWIIRVSGKANPPSRYKAKSNVFPIPGLSVVAPDDTLSQARAGARSEGSWSDSVLVRTALTSSSLELLRGSVAARTFDFRLATRGQIAPGDLLGFSQPGAGLTMFAAVSSLDPLPISPPDPSGKLVRVTTGPVYGEDPGIVLLAAARLEFELIVESPQMGVQRLGGLGFSPGHPRYWADLPTDDELFSNPQPVGLAVDAATPRFALAGLSRGSLFIPNAMPAFASEPATAVFDPQTALERDGLDSFDSSMFLEDRLRDTVVNDLLNEADYLRYPRDPRLDSVRLRGIHGALAVEEATLIAAPDAVHRGWTRNFSPPPADPPPSPPFNPAPDRDGFLDCARVVLEAPRLHATTPDRSGSFHLDWTASPPEAGVFILEEAALPDFSGATTLYRGSRTESPIYGHSRGVFYYRVRREVDSASSDWSNGVAIRIDGGPEWIANPTAGFDDRRLLDVQGALLRMCSARADLFGILSTPEHFREQDVLAHVAKLEPKTIGTREAIALGYGALYYPWLTGREETPASDLRTVPPEGAMAGVMAARSLLRGAWVAPANEPLRSPVALGSPVSMAYWQALQDARVNLIRQEPGGFVCLNSDTLSSDQDLRPLNVRRLMMLLRRAALRQGATYVFEPNNDAFRRTVERGFEAMLDRMFQLGAFAGSTAGEAFQVSTDDSLNTPASLDQGRFIVELRVAPSRPLRFLSVLLLQTAERVTIAEGQ